jgi:serine/threonine-protein kinase
VAVVYRCTHLTLGSEHAVKVVRYLSPTVARRMLDEGRAQAALVHPNVVRVTDAVSVERAPALVMELVRGPTLDEFLTEIRPSIATIDRIAAGIFAGVAAAHALGIVHRDLKPSNILLDIAHGDPVAKVADFGLVKVLRGSLHGSRRTRPGIPMGTPEYMSPEQMQSASDVDARADVFSLGAVLYELVTGERCFDAEDLPDLFHQVATCGYVPVTDHLPGAPARYVAAIRAALEPNRDRRCATVAQMAEIWFDGQADAYQVQVSAAPSFPPADPDAPTIPLPRTPTPSTVPPVAARPLDTWVPADLDERRRWHAAALWASSLTVLAGALALALILWRGPAASAPAEVLQVEPEVAPEIVPVRDPAPPVRSTPQPAPRKGPFKRRHAAADGAAAYAAARG